MDASLISTIETQAARIGLVEASTSECVASTSSTCLLRLRGLTPTTLWGSPACFTIPDATPTCSAETDVSPQTRLCLQPNDSVVVGRQHGGTLEYLDPAYRPTHVEPTTGQLVLRG